VRFGYAFKQLNFAKPLFGYGVFKKACADCVDMNVLGFSQNLANVR